MDNGIPVERLRTNEAEVNRMPMTYRETGTDNLTPQPLPERHIVYVGDIGFDDVTMSETVERIVQFAQRADRPRYICTGNLDHLALLQKDAEFRRIYADADLVLADGMPVVWLSGIFGEERLRERVAGSDLFWELSAASAKHGIKLFYLGGAPGAAEQAAESMRAQYPGVQIVGLYCPSFEAFGTEEEQARIRTMIRDARPHVLLVGLGAPKQEKWIYKNLSALDVPVSIGVGGTFEMAAGIVRRAPRWMQQSGLEWVYRLGQEPTRLWRRYVFRDIPFFFYLLRNGRRLRAARKKNS